ncbi:putative Cellular tumor antigen p53 protein [Naja naja]|nr:putative Cellular tumor antigen p53 protein [Naja naja]
MTHSGASFRLRLPSKEGESPLVTSAQQAIIPFSDEGTSSMDQANFDLLATTTSSQLTALANFNINPGLANFSGDPNFVVCTPKDYGAGDSCSSPPTEDYPGQFGFNLEFEPSGTAKSVTYTVRSGTGGRLLVVGVKLWGMGLPQNGSSVSIGGIGEGG